MSDKMNDKIYNFPGGLMLRVTRNKQNPVLMRIVRPTISGRMGFSEMLITRQDCAKTIKAVKKAIKS